MEPFDIIKQYGPWAILLYVAWRDVWPKVYDSFSAERKAQLARDEIERQAKVEEEREERKRKGEQEERLSKALDRFSEQMGTQSIALMTIAERLTSAERDVEAIRWAVNVISERMGVVPPPTIEGRK